MKATIVKAGLAAVGLAGILAAPALAAGDTSPNLPFGNATGAYIWHTDGPNHGWHVDTTDPRGSGAHEYTGTITTDGKFTDVHLARPEADDSVTVTGDGTLTFDFKTYSGIDGVDFRDASGHKLTFALYEDGQLMAPNDIHLGLRHRRHPDSNPFTLSI
ncbi:MAG: hypothetical protein KGJ86_06600 [Chloroflexota bacterium]|nr:hypothetical protein [Chloroflexota bacterium]